MIKNFLSDDEPDPTVESSTPPSTRSNTVISLFDDADQSPPKEPDKKKPFTLDDEDTVRQSGLAYSAGIAFFAAVVFMLILGWGADVLLGTSPWGIVVGIVLGSVIGFVQFFRITSQIFKK